MTPSCISYSYHSFPTFSHPNFHIDKTVISYQVLLVFTGTRRHALAIWSLKVALTGLRNGHVLKNGLWIFVCLGLGFGFIFVFVLHS